MAHLNEIRFSRLDDHHFTGRSLDFLVRHQTVTECWRKTDGDWKLVPVLYEEYWSLEQCREIAENVRLHMNLDQTGFGVFIGERIVGLCLPQCFSCRPDAAQKALLRDPGYPMHPGSGWNTAF